MLIGLAVTPAAAAEVDEAAAAASRDGFFVERGASITEQQAGELVGEMRNAGEGFILIALSEEPPAGATTFADNVQLVIGSGLVLVIAPESLGYAGEGDVFNEVELENALDAAFDIAGSDFDLAAAFVGELTGVAVVATPEPVSATTTAPTTQGTTAPEPTSGGGGNGFLWFVIIVGGLGLLLWWMMRRSKTKTQEVDAERLSKARYLIQEQLNDVANDILAMEDEVRVADNNRASRFYEQAGETYNEVSENLEETKTAQGLVDISNKLDIAIWQLDTAEAILDDKPLPVRPEPKRLEPPPRTGPTTAPPPRQPVPGPSSYQRRPQRKSSLGGGGLMDLLIVVGGGLLNSRRRSTSGSSRGRSGGGGLGGGLGDLFGRRSRSAPQQPRTPTPRPPTSSGQRSNPLPGPGRRATPSSKSRASTPKSSRQGTAGRVRSGRRRRKK